MSSGPEVHTVELDTGSNCDLPDARNDAMATNAVLDFILGLLRDEESFNAYCGNPQAAIDRAGLTGVTPADIMSMGVGGLLKEPPSRPRPREA